MAIRPGTIDLFIHQPIEVTSYTQENKEELIRKVRSVIASRLAS